MQGFFNVDLGYPLLWLRDGYELYNALIRLYISYLPGRDFMIYQNFYDVQLVAKYNFNLLNSSGLGILTFYFLTPIIRYYIVQTGRYFMLLPMYAWISYQWLQNLNLMYNRITFNLMAHWDMVNMGYVVGKLAVMGLEVATIIELMRTHQVDPKTGLVTFDMV